MAWILQGSLYHRNLVLGMLLTTTAALGFKISLKKGERAPQVQWVGIKFSLIQDNLIMTIPEKYTKDIVEVLLSWDNKGMAAIKELRQMAGRLSWVSGILPRTRWVVSVFYRVLHTRLRDIESGAEADRRSKRHDQRAKDHLFPVCQLEQARKWLIAYLSAAATQPAKKFKLDLNKYPRAKVVTDASPEGLGAILLINNRVVQAYASPVSAKDATSLGFTLGESSSQGIVEALAVLVALKLWSKELSSCQVEFDIQSDSVVALALTQKLSNSSPALNFIGAELAIQCEIAGIEYLKAGHIPGVLNTTPDWLSRPSTWPSKPKPKDLENVPIKTPPARNHEYYELPTPKEAPSLWATGAAAESAWASLR